MTYKRNCPNCDSILEYQNKRCWYNAKRSNAKCRKCYIEAMKTTIQKKLQNGEQWGGPRDKEREKTTPKPFHRECPSCKETISYIWEGSCKKAEEKGTLCNSCNTYKQKRTWNDIITPDSIKKMRARKAGYDTYAEYEADYPRKQFYKREVWRYTYKQPVETLPNWDKRGRCGVDGAYQLDHIKSIDWGYKNGVPPERIAEFSNLRMIPWKENLTKGK